MTSDGLAGGFDDPWSGFLVCWAAAAFADVDPGVTLTIPDPWPPGLGAPEDIEDGLEFDEAGDGLEAEAGLDTEGDDESRDIAAAWPWPALCDPEAVFAAELGLVLLPGMLSCFFIWNMNEWMGCK